MPVKSEDNEFVAYVVELMQPVGPVIAKRMFGGYGIFLNGLMFAIVVDGYLYFKADKSNENDFIGKGLQMFTYTKKDKEMRISYYQAPEETLEDMEEMYNWARKAYMTAVKAASTKRKK